MLIKTMEPVNRTDAQLGANPLVWSALFTVVCTIPLHTWKNVFLEPGELDDPEHLQIFSACATAYGD